MLVPRKKTSQIFSEPLPFSWSSHQSPGSALLHAKGGSGRGGLSPEQEGYEAASNTPGIPPTESHPL